MSIPNEAIEAAAKATQDACYAFDPGGWEEDAKFAEWARLILEAAASHMYRDWLNTTQGEK
jgi:hypothetical protein